MARFYGSVQGSRGEASRLGGNESGVTTHCASWSGAVRCYAYDKDGKDFVRVELVPWEGRGKNRVLYEGPFNPDAVTAVLNGGPTGQTLEGRMSE